MPQSMGLQRMDTTERLKNNKGDLGFRGGKLQRELLVLPPQSEGKIVTKAVSGTSVVARVKNLTASAGDRFDSQSWKIPHAAEQRSPCTATIEHVLSSLGEAAAEPVGPRAPALHREAPAVRRPGTATREEPHLQQLEKARVVAQTQHSQMFLKHQISFGCVNVTTSSKP